RSVVTICVEEPDGGKTYGTGGVEVRTPLERADLKCQLARRSAKRAVGTDVYRAGDLSAAHIAVRTRERQCAVAPLQESANAGNGARQRRIVRLRVDRPARTVERRVAGRSEGCEILNRAAIERDRAAGCAEIGVRSDLERLTGIDCHLGCG